MITITRSLARQLRAVFRRAGIGKAHGGYGPRVLFLADQDTLRIRAMSGHAAVEYQAAHQAGPVQVLLPLDLLDACEGSKPDPVQLDFTVADKVTASWTDKRVPVVLEFDTSAPDDTLPPFPPLPSSFATNEPDLWTALREAAAIHGPEPDAVRPELHPVPRQRRQARRHGRPAGVGPVGVHVPVDRGLAGPGLQRLRLPGTAQRSADPCRQDRGLGDVQDRPLGDQPEAGEGRPLPGREPARGRSSYGDFSSLPRRRATATSWPTPCRGCRAKRRPNRPITLDLNGQVLIRGKAADQSRATELVLSNSRLEGDAITVNSNREYLLRALRLGFREVHLYGNELPVLCDDGRRQFVWAL